MLHNGTIRSFARRAAIAGLAAVALCAPHARGLPHYSAARGAVAMSQELAKPPGTARILLTGDVMLGRGVDQVLPHQCDPALYEQCVRDAHMYVQLAVAANGPLPAQRGHEYPWGVALQDMEAKQPDARVINLETAVTVSPHPWPDKGINYRMHPGNVPTLTAAGVDVCVLGNNHVMDWGEQGLLETLGTLHAAGIQTAGAGRDLAEAESPAVVPLPSGGRLLVWSVGHSSSGVPDAWAAGQQRPGVLVTDLSSGSAGQLAALVQQHKQAGDIALVSVHWGSNWGYQVPQEQRRFAHALIDQGGVDVVHGHSSHHVKGAEVYRGKAILYGCGDLVSDYEGIRNEGIEAVFPHDAYRDDVGALWYADISIADGTLRQLILTPTRLKKLSLAHPEPRDCRYLEATLGRECSKLGNLRLLRDKDGSSSSLVLQPVAAGQEE